MFQSLHALGDLVRHQRNEMYAKLGHRSTGVAACELLDDLAALIATITDKVAADARPTRSGIMDYGDRAIAIMQSTQRTMDELGKLLDEGGAAVYQQRQPQTRLIARIESEGYAVDSADFTTVTDAKSYAALSSSDTPALHVQIEAERIAREEQARIYQKRLQRMETAIEKTETDYAQLIRQLAVRFE
ncbi:hypothetical protein [Mycobacterium simiae]|uniref:hypothetical protein n=1 Tax=Mycobacterium simiae TaxID=1784 RepID=UPI0026060C8B|nr:hypothetical protein [Mycobacterium simiae]